MYSTFVLTTSACAPSVAQLRNYSSTFKKCLEFAKVVKLSLPNHMFRIPFVTFRFCVRLVQIITTVLMCCMLERY